jgi:hypothetical protein
MRRSFLAAVLVAGLAAAGEIGGPAEFWTDFMDHGGYSIDLIFVDYASGGPVLVKLPEMQAGVKPLGITGRYPAGMGLPAVGGCFTNRTSLVYEIPGEGGWDLAVAEDPWSANEAAPISGPGEDIQPAVFGNRCVAFSRQNSDGGYDIALWTEDSGVEVLDLGPGNQMWPTFFYAASEEELAPPGADPYTWEWEPGGDDPLSEPVVLVYQDDPEGAYRLHYALVDPGGVVESVGELTGEGFDLPGEMMCPDIANQYYRGPDYYPDGSTPLAFHGLVDANRDIYLTEVRLDDDGLRLVAEGLERLTDWPGDEKFPELYTGFDYEAGEPAVWCFFAADRDGDYDIYALWVEGGRFYQLTDEPGTQTAPLVLEMGC